MTLADLQPFTQALATHGGREILPTALDTAGIRSQLDAAVRRQSLWSAQTLLTDLLEQYKSDIESILNPVTTQRPDRVTPENPQGNVTEGLNPAQARLRAKELLAKLGYAPNEGEAGTLKDLSSDARVNLVIKTNTELAQGAGRFIQANDSAVIDNFPAQELYRLEPRVKVRDWQVRWNLAAQSSGDFDAARVLSESGRMVALKASPIWDALGEGAGGYTDTLGNPYPPFAFNSGMWTRSVSRRDAMALGLIGNNQTVQAHPLNLANLFSTPA